MTKKLWQFPWEYPESALFVTAIALVGFLLQLAVGYFDFYILHAPANFVALAGLGCLIALGVRFRDTPFVRWFSGIPLAVALIAALLILGLYMELTPQLSRLPPQAPDLITRLGFKMMTSSWPFVLLYATTLTALGITTAKRLCHASGRDFSFLCNHLGLWVLLVSAGLGAADMQRVIMYVREGETEWRVHTKDNETLELPLAITLKDFRLEQYPPRLAIIDRTSGSPQPLNQPEYFQIDPKRPEGQLTDWAITLDEYLHEAVIINGEYRASPMPASTPAAKVTARNIHNGEIKTGWVSGGGNIPGFFSALTLDEHNTLAMTEPEPKRFASDITVYAKDGTSVSTILEVNKPLTAGNWMIYQYSYDTKAGKMSSYSAMELVYDPWLRSAQIGMGLMAIGSLLLVWNGAGRQRKAR
ncbi:MAG: cytochrome c biogenesis protein ResB [Azoarcus sp.]|jgi:hypothetical protein|nr:cytochrome c biogenesis protein ResB [Azoarcus sp.]